jgi:hypothetical protein
MDGMKEIVFTVAFTSLLVAGLTALPLLAKPKAQAADRAEGNVGRSVERPQASQAEDYWTPERMQNAQPAPLEHLGSPQPASQPQPSPTSEVSGSGGDSVNIPPTQQK